MTEKPIKSTAAKSVFWSMIDRFSAQGIQFVIGILIARILVPADFGLIAMLGIFTAIAQTIVDSGFANALIQKKDRTEKDYSTVFCFNIFISLLIYLILFFLAPVIASFYEEPRLVLIVRILSVSLIINSLAIVQQARMTIALDFKRLAIVSVVSVFISGVVAIYIANNGAGVWALVVQAVLSSLCRTVLMWIVSPWKISFRFYKESFKGLFSFGSKLLLSSLLHTIYVNIYTLIIGKKFYAAELGYYNRAFVIAQFPSTNLTNVIVRAIYPLQCRMQDDDKQLSYMFIKYLRMSCYIIFPIMIGLAVVAEPLVRILLTDKWIEVVPMLQILCVAYMWDPVMKINHNILNVKGRSDYFLKAEIWKKISAFTILFLTIPFGVKVMCMGLVLYSLCDMLIISYYVRKVIEISCFKQFKSLVPILLLVSVTGVVAYLPLLLSINIYFQIATSFILSIGTYVALSYIFKLSELLDLIKMLKSIK